VHRDVSIGNILSCDGHAKLADLEYAKKMGDSESHEIYETRAASELCIHLSGKSLIASQQGTVQFISIEVDSQKYQFPPCEQGLKFTSIDDYIRAMKERELRGEVTARKTVPFFHNHLHDLESLWWVAVWVVVYNYFSEGTPSRDRPIYTLQDARDQLILAQKLFPPRLDSLTRRDAFQAVGWFQRMCKPLPNNKAVIRFRLDLLREFLISHYMKMEAGYPQSVDLNTSDDIYEGFTRVFSISKTDSHGLVLDFIPAIYEKLSEEEERSKQERSKRPRSESTDDTGVSQKSQRM